MTRPQIVDGRDGLQMWRVRMNILNKELRTAGKEWCPPAWGLDEGLQTSHRKKKQLVTKYYTGTRNLWALMNTVMNLQVP